MAPDTIFGIAIAAVVVIGLVAKLLPKSRPKSQFFKCSRCNTASRHNDRTIEAWRNNKTKFFCQACHSKWLASQPPRVREQFSSRSSASGSSGCLGVVALFALLPLGGGLLMWAVA
ncbi:hypothetical protein [Luteimonas notoginsengisoli]|uniref:Uncharacterized protein n=1 Tax=Luteimonas notoginsengisoli TaxID=1578200 RepID=A0ABV7UTJ7_9GAMM